MPTITAQSILNKAAIVLQDTTNIRWPVTELLTWLNDGQREISAMRPDVTNVIETVKLVPGTRQSLPATGQQLLAVRRNMLSSGLAGGDAIRKVPMDLLDSQRPGWHVEPISNVIKHYVYDPRTPRTYYVYPPANTTAWVEIVYDAPPAMLSNVTDVISLDDEYSNMLLEYVLFRAYSKDHDQIGNAERAMAHRQMFDSMLSAKNTVDSGQQSVVNVKG
jgi:hypothetical protein